MIRSMVAERLLTGFSASSEILARRNHKAVVVVGDNLLTLGREVPLRVCEQVRLVRIRLNERALVVAQSGAEAFTGRTGAQAGS